MPHHNVMTSWRVGPRTRSRIEKAEGGFESFGCADIKASGINRLKSLVAEQPSVKGRRIHVLEGDFNQKINDILVGSKIAENTATFCLLDQRMFECEMEDGRELAPHKKDGRKIELFYFLGTGWLDRSLRATTCNTHRIENWWGRPDWKQLACCPEVRANLFCERFKARNSEASTHTLGKFTAVKRVAPLCITWSTPAITIRLRADEPGLSQSHQRPRAC